MCYLTSLLLYDACYITTLTFIINNILKQLKVICFENNLCPAWLLHVYHMTYDYWYAKLFHTIFWCEWSCLWYLFSGIIIFGSISARCVD